MKLGGLNTKGYKFLFAGGRSVWVRDQGWGILKFHQVFCNTSSHDYIVYHSFKISTLNSPYLSEGIEVEYRTGVKKDRNLLWENNMYDGNTFVKFHSFTPIKDQNTYEKDN